MIGMSLPAGHQTGHHALVTGFWTIALVSLFLFYLGACLTLRPLAVWPWYRSLLWGAGLTAGGLAVIGPVAERSDHDFVAHMLGHLLLGMLAPVLLVLAAPITLMLRALPTAHARWIVRCLGTRPLRAIIHPVTAATFDIGGLWLLYTTGLFAAMHTYWWLNLLIHIHVLVAGYLFTAAIIGTDPIRHRPSWTMQAVVLVIALGAHTILAKYLYAHPPAGTSSSQAESASLLMYYGGDIVDTLLITVFWWQWYHAGRPRP